MAVEAVLGPWAVGLLEPLREAGPLLGLQTSPPSRSAGAP